MLGVPVHKPSDLTYATMGFALLVSTKHEQENKIIEVYGIKNAPERGFWLLIDVAVSIAIKAIVNGYIRVHWTINGLHTLVEKLMGGLIRAAKTAWFPSRSFLHVLQLEAEFPDSNKQGVQTWGPIELHNAQILESL